MDTTNSTMARQIAQAASIFVQQSMGHAPASVTVVLNNTTLVITLHGTLSKAEMAMAKSPEGAAQVQDFHRQLFANTSESLWQEIKRITGAAVCEVTADIGVIAAAVLERSPTGTVVQEFLLAHSVPANAWSGVVSSRELACA